MLSSDAIGHTCFSAADVAPYTGHTCATGPLIPPCSQEVKYHQWLEGLDLMLKHYYEVIGQLTPIERELLGKKGCERTISEQWVGLDGIQRMGSLDVT